MGLQRILLRDAELLTNPIMSKLLDMSASSHRLASSVVGLMLTLAAQIW